METKIVNAIATLLNVNAHNVGSLWTHRRVCDSTVANILIDRGALTVEAHYFTPDGRCESRPVHLVFDAGVLYAEDSDKTVGLTGVVACDCPSCTDNRK